MHKITVDLSQIAPSISSQYGGEMGEHQAVELTVIPETAMLQDESIAFYYILFKVEGGLVSSRTYNVGEEITCALWDQLTALKQLQFQLIGTNGEETIVSKSAIITLYLGDSLEGTVIGIDDNRDSLIAMIGAFNERLSDDETKLDTIETGAQVNIQSDWGQSDTSEADYIKNKPSMMYEIAKNSRESKDSGQIILDMYNKITAHPIDIPFSLSIYRIPVDFIQSIGRDIYIYVSRADSTTKAKYSLCYSIPMDGTTITRLDSTAFTLTPDDKAKFDAIETGEVAEGDTGYVTGGAVYSALAAKQDTLTAGTNITIENNVISATGGGASVQSDWEQDDSTAPDYIKNKPDLSVYAESSDLASVATSGAYSDLSGTPSLANVATSGDYDDLTNKPTIPAAQVQSDWNESDSSKVDYIKNKPSLATVATSGSYADLANTPTIPSDAEDIDYDNTDSGLTATDVQAAIDELAQGGGGFVVSDTAPSDTGVLWIDPSDDTTFPAGTNVGDLLVWNGTEWVARPKWQSVFQPVEYIESTGTQYINTEIIPTLNDVVSFTAQHTQIETGGANLVACADYSASPITRFILGGYTPSSQNSEWQIACSDWTVWGVQADTNKHDFEYNASTKKYKIDETEYTSTPTVTELPNVSLSIFCRHQKDTMSPYNFYSNLSKSKLYRLKITRSQILLAEFIPCYRITDGEIGLYETVEGKFYTNAGTGTFIKGADV